jgi:hypothetical protein
VWHILLIKSVRMIPAGDRFGHDIRSGAVPETLGAARLNPHKPSGMDHDGWVVPDF